MKLQGSLVANQKKIGMGFYALFFPLLLSVGLQLWYSPAYFEIAPVRLVWSLLLLWGKCFYIRKVFHLASLERVFSVVVPFSKMQLASQSGQARKSKKYIFWQYAVFFAYQNDSEIPFSGNNKEDIFLFFWLGKKRNTLSDVRNTLGAIPARRGMLWVANRSGSCKAGCPRCVVFNRASLASLALLCLNSLCLLKSNY